MNDEDEETSWHEKMSQRMRASQEESDASWAEFIRTPAGGCFTVLVILLVLGSIIYGVFLT